MKVQKNICSITSFTMKNNEVRKLVSEWYICIHIIKFPIRTGPVWSYDTSPLVLRGGRCPPVGRTNIGRVDRLIKYCY